MSIKQARELGGKAFREQWGASLLALLLGLAGMIVAGTAVPLIGILIVEGPISVGVLYVYYKAACGEKIEYKEMLVGFKTNFGEIVLASLIKSAFLSAVSAVAYGLIATFTVVFRFIPALAVIFDVLIGIAAIVALIIISLFLAEVEYIMMREPEAKGWEAVKKSRQIMKGNTGKLFGFTLSFLGWIILTIVFFPVAVFTMPYYYMSLVFFLGSIYDEAERKLEAERKMQAMMAEQAEKAREAAKAAREEKAKAAKAAKAEQEEKEKAEKPQEEEKAKEAEKAQNEEKDQKEEKPQKKKKAKKTEKPEETGKADQKETPEVTEKEEQAETPEEPDKEEQAEKPKETKKAKKPKKAPKEEKTESETSAKRFCTECGSPLAEDAAFCSNCGKKL